METSCPSAPLSVKTRESPSTYTARATCTSAHARRDSAREVRRKAAEAQAERNRQAARIQPAREKQRGSIRSTFRVRSHCIQSLCGVCAEPMQRASSL
eukprot:4087349-Pleurochrysis_carterae.AAC.1